jgi:hypothetical protein
MKLKVGEDELYPIYDLSDGFGKEVEVSEELYKEYTEVMDKFWNMQYVLEGLYRSKPDEKSPLFKVKDRYNFSWEEKK